MLITSKVSPVLLVIPASLSGADGVVVAAFSFEVTLFIIEELELPPLLAGG